MSGKIRVLIVDDHLVVRRGLTELLGATDDMEVVGAADDGEEGVVLALSEEPDIVLMDIAMPGMDGMEATQRILTSRPETRVVMLTSMSGHERIVDALKLGAVGYVFKDTEPDDLLAGIRTAANSAGINPHVDSTSADTFASDASSTPQPAT